MAQLRLLGTVVWLKGDFGEMYERARRAGPRPMLAERSRAEVEALYREREPHYRAAHLVIETRGLGVDQVVGRILRVLPQSHGARV
jgi:shikimate kinase